MPRATTSEPSEPPANSMEPTWQAGGNVRVPGLPGCEMMDEPMPEPPGSSFEFFPAKSHLRR
ncbi:MAG TPA: hypothetical protein VJL34_09310 [Anaerolineales bacterium]|nr:hypothetical protein [Anaerolineales bacterium]